LLEEIGIIKKGGMNEKECRYMVHINFLALQNIIKEGRKGVYVYIKRGRREQLKR